MERPFDLQSGEPAGLNPAIAGLPEPLVYLQPVGCDADERISCFAGRLLAIRRRHFAHGDTVNDLAPDTVFTRMHYIETTGEDRLKI